MNVITFYEKIGCATNQKQKKLLTENGCMLQIKNLLDSKFSPETLIRFFDPLPVHAWFNPNAPKIKNGMIDPRALNAEEAILAMQKEPILIKRPLMVIGEHYLCGFNTQKLSEILNQPIESIDNTCSKNEDCHTLE